ncbi:MAG: hypothetical protein ACQGVC_13060 [Myxococcota bacterium]
MSVPLRTALWAVCAGLLLLVVFAGYVAVVARLAPGDAETVERTRQGLALYAGIVLLKGLLPQLVATFVLYAVLAPRLDFERSRGRVVLGVVGCAAAAGLLAAGLLLPLELPGLPSVRYRGVGNFAATALELTAGVSLACLAARFAVPVLRPRGS